MTETNALAVVVETHEIGSGALASASPQQFVEVATEMARALAPVVDQQKLFTMIQGKKHVNVEGWTTLSSMLGVFPCEVLNEDMGDGRYVAVVELRKPDGSVVGRASSECGGQDDKVWGKREAYARRSMAATRATSKACRLSFSWIMTLAGFAGTPAEEMDFATKEPTEPRRATKQAGSGSTSNEWDGQLVIKSGQNKGKRWADLNTGFLDWAIKEKLDEPIGKMAQKELARRAREESAQTDMPFHEDEEPPF